MGSEVGGGLGPAEDGLDQVGGVPAGNEGGFGNRGVVLSAPGGVFRGFEDEGGAREEGGY